MNYERILAADIQAGDRIARARTHEFKTVTEVRHGERAVKLIYGEKPDVGYIRRSGDPRPFDRPLKTAKWWKESA